MKYKGYEIMIEASVETAVYKTNDKGELDEWYEDIDSEPEERFFGIYKDDEAVDWIDYAEGISGAKDLIDQAIKLLKS